MLTTLLKKRLASLLKEAERVKSPSFLRPIAGEYLFKREKPKAMEFPLTPVGKEVVKKFIEKTKEIEYPEVEVKYPSRLALRKYTKKEEFEKLPPEKKELAKRAGEKELEKIFGMVLAFSPGELGRLIPKEAITKKGEILVSKLQTEIREFARKAGVVGEEISQDVAAKIYEAFSKKQPKLAKKIGVLKEGVELLPKVKKPAEVKIGEIKKVKPTLKETWQKISGYPKKGDYVRVEWRGKTFEGKITGEKPVRFRTGYVAKEITTKEGVKKWMPWTRAAKYEVRVEKPIEEVVEKAKPLTEKIEKQIKPKIVETIRKEGKIPEPTEVVEELKKPRLKGEDVKKITEVAGKMLVKHPEDPILVDTSQRIFKRLAQKLSLGEIQWQDLPEILKKYNHSVEDFAVFFEKDISENARVLNQLGQFARRFNLAFKQQIKKDILALKAKVAGRKDIIDLLNKLEKNYPQGETEGLIKSLDELLPDELKGDFELIKVKFDKIKELSKNFAKYEKELTFYDRFKNWYRKVDMKRRGLMVGQLATAMRNLLSQIGRFSLDIPENLITGTFLKARKFPAEKVYADAFADMHWLLRYLSKDGRKAIQEVLDKYPIEAQELLSAPVHDITMGDKLVRVVNTFNTLQEMTVRKISFAAKLDALLKQYGYKSLEKCPKRTAEEILDKAVKHSLEITFAKKPAKGFGLAVMRIYNQFPFLTALGNPYPRFWMNSFEFLINYNPTGFARLFSKQFRQKLASANMMEAREAHQYISKAIIGTMLLSAGLAIRNSKFAGEKWYQIKISKDKYLDTRAFAPFSTYLFLGEMMSHPEKLTGYDYVQGIVSINRIAGTGLVFLDLIRARKLKTPIKILSDFIGQYLGGFTVPFRTLQDFLGGVIPEEKYYRYTYGGAMMRITGSTLQNLPFLQNILPPAPSITRKEYMQAESPILRQLTGLSVRTKKKIEQEIDKLNIPYSDLRPKTGIPRLDYLTQKEMGKLVESRVNLLLNSSMYKNADDERKEDLLRNFFSKIRTEARNKVFWKYPSLKKKYQEKNKK